MALLLVSRKGEGVWNPKVASGELLIGDDFGAFFLFDMVIEEPGLLATLESAVGASQGRAPLEGVMVGRGSLSFLLSGVIVGECKAERSAPVGTCSVASSWPGLFLASSASSLMGTTMSFPAMLRSGSP